MCLGLESQTCKVSLVKCSRGKYVLVRIMRTPLLLLNSQTKSESPVLASHTTPLPHVPTHAHSAKSLILISYHKTPSFWAAIGGTYLLYFYETQKQTLNLIFTGLTENIF